jgi:predicted metal-binding protein
MTLTEPSLVSLALTHGATRAAIVNVSDVQFSDTFRDLCKMNSCGNFEKNWKCPPAVGEYEELKNQVLSFNKGLVIQTVYHLEDSFDFEGMVKAKAIHEKVFRSVWNQVRNENLLGPILPLNAGICSFCEKCTYPDEECRYPEEALSSVEAYGIDVTALVTACGIPYNNGQASVSWVGAIFFND